MNSGIKRDSVAIGGEDRRIYYDESNERMGLSVSTVTDIRDNPEKKEALKGWRDSYDGSDEDSYPHYEEQKTYKQLRGTLGHYVILSNLGDVPKGDEETEAEYTLKNWADERPSQTTDDVSHIGDDHAYDGEQAWSKCMRDINWTTNEFLDIADDLGINPDSTIACEEYIYHKNPLYGGQFDLLYTAEDGVTTLCDLKLASGIRYEYKLQLAAYRRAILQSDEGVLADIEEIPRLQIIRMHPDTGVVEVQTNDDSTMFCRGEMYVEDIKESRDDGRLEWSDTSNLDNMEDCWTADAHLTPPSWETNIEGLTAEFLTLVEKASDEWLTQITWSEFQERIST